MKVALQNPVRVPPQVCLQCFNEQQQFGFPFVVYCSHNQVLAVVQGTAQHVTFECAPEQLEAVLQKLEEGGAQAIM